MNRKTIYYFLPVIIIFFFSCSIFYGSRLSSLIFSSPEELIRFVNKNSSKLESLTGNALISIESPEYSGRFDAKIRLKMPDLLWIKVEGALGIDVVTILKEKNEIDFYFNREKILFRVKKENLTVEKLLEIFEDTDNIDKEKVKYVSSTEIMNVFSGVTKISLNPSDTVKVFKRENNKYFLEILKFEKEKVKENITVSLKNRCVVNKKTFNNNGSCIFNKDYSRFTKIKGIYLPGRIKFLMPHLKRRLTIIYRNREINKNLNKKDFFLSLPERYDEYIY